MVPDRRLPGVLGAYVPSSVAMRQRKLGSHTPPCHRRMVITTLFSVFLLHCSADQFCTTPGGCWLCFGFGPLDTEVSSHPPPSHSAGWSLTLALQVVPLSSTCSLVREDVSYPNLKGAKAPLVALRRLNISTKAPAAGHLYRSLPYCVALTFSPPHHACTCHPHFHAHSYPTPSHGPHSRGPCHASAFQHVTTCRACAPAAQWRPVISPLYCSVLPWRPIHPGQLEPTTLPLRRLAPDSCSVAYTGAMRQRKLGSHTPPCHRRMVITTIVQCFACCTAA